MQMLVPLLQRLSAPLTLLLVCARADAAPLVTPLSCKNDLGHNVDTYTMLKTPNGPDYFYADDERSTLKRSTHDVSSKTSGALAHTLGQIYGKKSGVAFAMYNDETPDGKKSGSPRAHAKGVLAFNSAGGFWLVHSVPGFPAEASSKSYDGCCSNGLTYGQSFMCLSLSNAELNSVVKQYLIKCAGQSRSHDRWATARRCPRASFPGPRSYPELWLDCRCTL